MSLADVEYQIDIPTTSHLGFRELDQREISRFLNNPGAISLTSSERILRIVREMNPHSSRSDQSRKCRGIVKSKLDELSSSRGHCLDPDGALNLCSKNLPIRDHLAKPHGVQNPQVSDSQTTREVRKQSGLIPREDTSGTRARV